MPNTSRPAVTLQRDDRHRFKTLCALVLVPLLLTAPSVSRATDHWTGPDKLLHFESTLVLAGIVSAATESQAIGFWSAVAVGGAKELWDRNRSGHTASFKDLAWDVAGAYVGSAFGAWAVSRTNGTTVVSYAMKF